MNIEELFEEFKKLGFVNKVVFLTLAMEAIETKVLEEALILRFKQQLETLPNMPE